ncbi:MAG: cation-translocating P-type ATPase [Anaerolineae bacterium]
MILEKTQHKPITVSDGGLDWFLRTPEAVAQALKVDPVVGLSEAAIQERQTQYGLNELREAPLRSPLKILWEQLTNPLVLLLLGAAAVSALLGKTTELIAILAIVVLNAALGVAQEYRAEKAMAALKKMSAPQVRVRRGGRVLDIDPAQLVPGDIVLLEAGSIIPADARLIEAANLKVQEASLTGESEPVEKDTEALTDHNAPLGDRRDMVYFGTAVTYGRGVALVTATGMLTELGRIAQLIQMVEAEKTPLQRRLAEMGRVLLLVALGVMAVSFVIGAITGQPLDTVLLESVAIAVAVVPEGLPAVITVALALGAQRMLRRRALVRRLTAVETLGSVTTICSDKTGTLTQNKMTVTLIDVGNSVRSLDDIVIQGVGKLQRMNGTARTSTTGARALVLAGSALCTDVTLEGTGDSLNAIGEPTEVALVMASARYGMAKPTLDGAFPRVGEIPFDSERKRMTTVHHLNNQLPSGSVEESVADVLNPQALPYVAFSKGAVDSLLRVCAYAWIEGEIVLLTDSVRARIDQANDQMAANGLRVLGLAYRFFDALPGSWNVPSVESELIFVGMVGIIDPPRPEVKDAVAVAKGAGIRPVMITGDHPLTAAAIAREIGIVEGADAKVLTGAQLSEMSPEQLREAVPDVSVYARVSPENKLNIVEALQARGQIVAMTGDGVNDAPALKRSNIGVAMGITGTAVSKEASDMVILDDNFATIVAATEEGRTIYDNVRRFIKYLLASNTGELLVLLATQLIVGMTIPLTTLQILWMNLITDGLPALALGVEKSEKGVMKRPPYDPNESLFGRGLGRHIVIVGTVLGGTGIALAYWAWSSNILAANGKPAWNTMVFVFLTIAQMGHAYGLRSHVESSFKLPFFGNPLLLVAIGLTVLVQVGGIYMPFFNNIFNTNPLTLEQLALCLVLSTVVLIAVEIEKIFIRRGVLH